jgi:hypothetical protein
MLECDPWNDNCKPVFIDCDLESIQDEDPILQEHVNEWATLTQYVALGGHSLVLEDGPEICDPEQTDE